MPVSKMTCTFWAKIAANASDHILSNETATGYAGSIVVYTSSGDGKLSFRRGNADDTEWTSTTANDVSDNTWHHFACVDTGSTALDIYIDGIKDTVATAGSYSATAVASSINTLIGEDARTSGTAYFTGNLAQLGLWQGALTQAQIQEVMEQTYATMTPSIKSTLGTECTDDGDFDTDTAASTTGTHWTTTANVVISDGVAVFSAPTSADVMVYQDKNDSLKNVGSIYKIVYTITAYTSGNHRVELFGGSPDTTASTGTGTFTSYVVNASSNGTLYFTGSGTFVGTLSNLSVKEVTNDLVGYWALDGSDGKALSFTTNDFIDCGGDSSLAVGDDGAGMTTSAWILGGGDGDICGKWQEGAGYSMSITSSKPIFFVKTSDDYLYATGSGMSTTVWHHVVFTKEGATITAYIDGAQTATTGSRPVDIGVSTNNFRIGHTGRYGYYSKDIAQVGVYDAALTSAQVSAQYSKGINGDWSSDSNLVGYWRLDSTGVLPDLSSNSNDGTVDGATLVDGFASDKQGNNDGDFL